MLINHFPSWEIFGQITSQRTAADKPTRDIKNITRIVNSLSRVFREQAKIRNDEFPFRVRHIIKVADFGVSRENVD